MERYILTNLERIFGTSMATGIDEGKGYSQSAMAIKCSRNKEYDNALKELFNYTWKYQNKTKKSSGIE